MIAVVFALPEESREFRAAVRATAIRERHWRAEHAGRELLIAHCGVGPTAAAHFAREFLATARPDFLIATGFAGALAPQLALGDLVLGANVSHPALLAAAQSCGIRTAAGSLLSVDLPLETVAAKRAAHLAGALAVDMETSALATACLTAGVPLLSVRAISDLATDALPIPFATWFDLTRQRPKIPGLCGYLIRHPQRIPPFLRFVRGLRAARRALAAFLVALLAAPLATPQPPR